MLVGGAGSDDEPPSVRRTSDVQKASFDSRSTSALRSTSIVATARVPPAAPG